MATQAKEVFLTPPLTIAGCQLWLDGADPVGTGVVPTEGAKSSWVDKSRNGWNAKQSTSARQPSLVLNSLNRLPGFRFTSANNQSFITDPQPSLNNISGISVFAILLPTWSIGQDVRNPAFFGMRIYNGGGASKINYYLHNNYSSTDIFNSSGVSYHYVSGLAQNTVFMYSGTNNNGTDLLYPNGSLTADSAGASFGSTTNLPIIVGGNNEDFENWEGYIYEAIFFNLVVNTTQRQQVEGYLAWKWGLQALLPRSHPFFSASPYQTLSVPISRSIPLRMSSSTYFSPTAISGCALWLDGADTSTFTFSSGSNISQWNDKSSQLNNATQSTSSNQAVLTNSRVSFTPTQFMVLDSTKLPNGSASVSYFMVVESTGSSPASVFFSHGDGNNGFTLQLYFNGGDILRQDLNGASIVSDTLNTRNQTIIVSNILTSTNEELWRNGNSVASLAITKSIGTGIARIGINVNGFWPFTGTITEIIVYSSALTTTQRQQIEGYLAWKWGLQASLPPTHPNYTVPYVPFPFPTSIPKAAIRVWSPLRIAGSQLWLDAADTTSFTLSGSTVTQWSDKSGVGNNATPHSTGPQRVGNSVLFSGSNALKCGKFLTSTSYSVFIVNNFPSGSDNNISFGCWKVQSGSSANIQGGAIRVGVNNSQSYSVNIVNSTASSTVNHIYGLTVSSSSTPGSAFTLNGSIDGSNALLSGTSVSGNATTCEQDVTIGGLMESGTPQFQLNGYVYEVIVYNSALSTAQRQQVEGYLAWKWGLRSNLPAGHPYINFPPSP